ncbi:MAG: SAP domain-containing protein, partial [Chromatiaceae bacterium]|nr:SAP domain-containing protein [Candidatus Thioaporhodococcus sediminis]
MLYDALTVDLLREIARRHGLATTGTKADLIDRLQAFEFNIATSADQTTGSATSSSTSLDDDHDDQQPSPAMAAQPPATTPAAIWNLYSDDQIQNMVRGQGFDMTNIVTKADMVAALALIPGLTPSNAIAAYNALPRDLQPKVTNTLDKQASNEPVDR